VCFDSCRLPGQPAGGSVRAALLAVAEGMPAAFSLILSGLRAQRVIDVCKHHLIIAAGTGEDLIASRPVSMDGTTQARSDRDRTSDLQDECRERLPPLRREGREEGAHEIGGR
jgi:hypothetical protein